MNETSSKNFKKSQLYIMIYSIIICVIERECNVITSNNVIVLRKYLLVSSTFTQERKYNYYDPSRIRNRIKKS